MNSGGGGSVTYTKLTGTATLLDTNKADIIAGVAATVDESGAASTFATVAQINSLQTQISGKAGATLTYTKVNDTSANIIANADGGGNVLDITGKTVTVTTASNVSNYGKMLSAATDGGAGGTVAGAVADTAANLASGVTLTGATSVTATISNANDLVTVTLDSEVTHIDISTNEVANVLLDINDLTNRTITNAGSAGSYKVKDTAENLAGADASLLNGQTIIINDTAAAATTTELNTIQTKMGGGSVTYTKLSGTAAQLVTNKADIIAGVAATAVETGAASTFATAADIVALNAQISGKAGASITYTKLNDTAENLAEADASILSGKTVTIDETGGASTYASTSELNTIQANSGETVTYTKLTDTASNLVTNKADIVSGVTATIVETGAASTFATVAQIGTLNTQVSSASGGAALTYTKLNDTAANLAAAASSILSGKTVTIDETGGAADYASTSELNTIQANSGETVTYTKLTDTASNLDTNKADIVAGVTATAVETGAASTFATIAQINSLQAQASTAGGGASFVYTKVNDTSANIIANADGGGNVLDITGKTVTVTTASNVSNYGKMLSAATDGGAGGTVAGAVADTAANLASGVTLTGATSVTATISNANDLVTVTLDSEVTHIDISTNEVANVLLDINDLTNRTITNAGSAGSYRLKILPKT